MLKHPSLYAISAIVLATFALAAWATAAETTEGPKLTYPKTRKSDQTDDYHGTQIADPYRWLEDPDSDETKAWVDAQNEVTFGFLEQLPQRKEVRARLTKLWNFERFSLPRSRGGRYLYERNDGLQNQSVLYVAEMLDAEPRVLLDPNKLSEDGTVDLAGWRTSDDGKYLAYGLAASGSDWREWKVLDVETGKPLGDHLRWVKFSGVSWSSDNKGFFYSRYDEPKDGTAYTGANYYQKLYYHRLGEPQSNDTLVYQREDEKEWGFDGEVTEDGRYLVIGVWKGTERKNQVFYQDLRASRRATIELLSDFDAEYHFLGNDGPLFWFLTDSEAPMRRVIAIDIRKPQREHWTELISESTRVLEEADLVGDFFFASYLKDATSLIRVHDLAGKHVRDVELPGLGTASGFGGRRDQQETFYSFSNFTTPPTIFRYDLSSGQSSVFRKPDVDFQSQDYETKQVFCTSTDGTKVPMFVTSKKGLKLTGDNPTILYGYGGFDISLTPGFSVTNAVWLEMGGVYVMANLRGGGEYGRQWHEAGMKDKKQNVFDDFLSSAEFLIDQKYTSRDKLAIMGRSNGGLLVGAAMTQRPDLFAAAAPGVGVMDMLRYHKFTIGWAWVSEYGSADDADEFTTLLAYSPLHNLNPGTRYPATIVTTGDHDDRVVPAHSHKFAATLQAAQAEDGPPTLIRIDTSAGHGAGKPTAKIIEESADVLTFLWSVVGDKAD